MVEVSASILNMDNENAIKNLYELRNSTNRLFSY